MKNYEKFIERFPTTDDFEKAYPVGKKITWCDRTKRTIVGYLIDEQFKKKDDFSHLVAMKYWVKHKQSWYYDIVDSFVFYSVVEMMEREVKAEQKLVKNNSK